MGCTMSFQYLSKGLQKDNIYKRNSFQDGPLKSLPAEMSDDHFSHKQKMLLRETWNIIREDKRNHGITILIMIFDKKPETKHLFPFRDLEGDELTCNAQFCSHAKRFMHAVEATIQHLDALEMVMVPLLHRLGEKHASIDGFKEEYFSVFVESIQDVIADALGKKCTAPVRDAWGQLGKFIAGKMHEGYKSAQVAMRNGVVRDVDGCPDKSV